MFEAGRADVKAGMNVDVPEGMNVDVPEGMNVDVPEGMNVDVAQTRSGLARATANRYQAVAPACRYG